MIVLNLYFCKKISILVQISRKLLLLTKIYTLVYMQTRIARFAKQNMREGRMISKYRIIITLFALQIFICSEGFTYFNILTPSNFCQFGILMEYPTFKRPRWYCGRSTYGNGMYGLPSIVGDSPKFDTHFDFVFDHTLTPGESSNIGDLRKSIGVCAYKFIRDYSLIYNTTFNNFYLKEDNINFCIIEGDYRNAYSNGAFRLYAFTSWLPPYPGTYFMLIRCNDIDTSEAQSFFDEALCMIKQESW